MYSAGKSQPPAPPDAKFNCPLKNRERREGKRRGEREEKKNNNKRGEGRARGGRERGGEKEERGKDRQ